MTFWKKEATRRQAITAAALGTLAAGYPLSLRAKPTAQEKANIQVVKDFCEAWPAHDVGKIISYFADNCAYRPLETMETAKGREAVEKEIKRFVNNVERFEILETWARGPMVVCLKSHACSSSLFLGQRAPSDPMFEHIAPFDHAGSCGRLGGGDPKFGVATNSMSRRGLLSTTVEGQQH